MKICKLQTISWHNHFLPLCNIGAKFKLNPPYRHLINSKSSWPLLIKPMRVLSLHLFLQFHTHDFFSCKWHHLQKSTRLTFLASTVDSQGFDCICKQATNHADFSTLQIGDQSVHWLKSYDQKVHLCPKQLFGHTVTLKLESSTLDTFTLGDPDIGPQLI